MLAAEVAAGGFGELEGAGSDFDRVSSTCQLDTGREISCAQDQEGSAAEIGETN